MIRQSLLVDNSILEKKFKILRTSIMLGNLRNREETLREFEECAKEVDHVRALKYEEALAGKMYTTTTLEEEEIRLKELITLIENRVDEQNDFMDDYIKITANFLDVLDKVSHENDIDEYRYRLRDISEYLANCKEMEEIGDKLKVLRDELEEKYENKASNDIVNGKLEDELIDEFNKIISKDEYYASLNYPDIENELGKIDSEVIDKKDVMNTFISSYEALKNAGITGAEREEYLSYVQDAKMDYYQEIEKKFMLNIYKLILDRQVDYDRLYEKRNNIEIILEERDRVRSELEISDNTSLDDFVKLCREQFNIIKSQKFNIEGIDKLIEEIDRLEERLEKLELANSREGITGLLNEFSVVKPEIEKIVLPVEEKIQEEVITKNKRENFKKPNVVIRISEPIKLNVKTASDAAKLVMKKVVIVLEPKKFNEKRDKIKEAEIELENKKIEEAKVTNEDVTKEAENEEFKDHKLPIIENNNVLEDDKALGSEIFTDLGNSDNEILYGDKNKESSITIPDDIGTVPTEIMIEEPEEEVIDLFSETDPFLDDNEFEMAHDDIKEEKITSNMPEVKNIGTVRPNNLINEVKKAEDENSEIILPTMGITNNSDEVPIVSENYID